MNNNKVGLTTMGALQLVFIVLKLTGVIGWSWFWVLSPIWIEVLLVFAIVLFLLWLRR